MNNTQSINTEDLIRDLTVKNSVSKEVTLPQAISNFFAAKELQLSEKMQKEQLDMETHKEHIELFLKLNEKINMALDDQGSLDISDNKEIQDLIAQAMEAGAVLKSDLLKMNPQQGQQLIANLKSAIERSQLDSSFNQNKMQQLLHIYTEVCTICTSMQKTDHEAKLSIARKS
jgi:ribosomal protein S10